MRAYRTYMTIKDPRQVILSNVPFRAGQEVEIVFLAKDEDQTMQTEALKDLFKATQTLPAAQALSEEEILREVERHRSGQ